MFFFFSLKSPLNSLGLKIFFVSLVTYYEGKNFHLKSLLYKIANIS